MCPPPFMSSLIIAHQVLLVFPVCAEGTWQWLYFLRTIQPLVTSSSWARSRISWVLLACMLQSWLAQLWVVRCQALNLKFISIMHSIGSQCFLSGLCIILGRIFPLVSSAVHFSPYSLAASFRTQLLGAFTELNKHINVCWNYSHQDDVYAKGFSNDKFVFFSKRKPKFGDIMSKSSTLSLPTILLHSESCCNISGLLFNTKLLRDIIIWWWDNQSKPLTFPVYFL